MGVFHCNECGEEREVQSESDESAIEPPGLERDYRVYYLICGHEVSFPTSVTRPFP